MEYYAAIKRNRFELAELRWMTLEAVIQSKLSYKEKNKYHISTHVESRKMVLMNLFARQEWRCSYRKQTVDTAGEGEDGVH